MGDRLSEVYDPENFKKFGYEIIDLLTDYLRDAQQGHIPVIDWKVPDDQFEYWKNYNIEDQSPTNLFKDIIESSIHIHHPNYMGHQVCPPAPISALASLVSSMLNNGMAIYEMGASATAIEKVIIELLVQKVGYSNNGDGFITSGGTIGNLTGLLAARQKAVQSDIWENGLNEKLGVMVSSEAHYSVDRALRIMGFGASGIIKIPVTENFTMKTQLLDEYFTKAVHEGIKIIAVVGSAPSTSTGMYDDLVAIAKFCSRKNLWFHVDAAHGGGVIFSDKYKNLLAGIENADSIVIDGHKMLMTPAIMTFLLFKEKNNSYSTFSQKAQYLLEKSGDEEWYNLASRTIECTKLMMSIKFFSILKLHGEEIFGQYVTYLYDLGKVFANKINQSPDFELALHPHSNIVCFRYFNKDIYDNQLNDLNSEIRNEILVKGEFYIVQTLLNDIVYLRTTLMNPNTTSEILSTLIEEIRRLGEAKLSSYLRNKGDSNLG